MSKKQLVTVVWYRWDEEGAVLWFPPQCSSHGSQSETVGLWLVTDHRSSLQIMKQLELPPLIIVKQEHSEILADVPSTVNLCLWNILTESSIYKTAKINYLVLYLFSTWVFVILCSNKNSKSFKLKFTQRKFNWAVLLSISSRLGLTQLIFKHFCCYHKLI